MFSFAFEAIGTRWGIDVLEELTPEGRTALLRSIESRIEAFDRTYSRFRADSTVTEMSAHAGAYRLPEDAAPMLDVYERLYRATDGAFTPLIGQTLVEAGYDAEYSLVPKTLHAPPTWDEAIAYVAPVLTVKRPALLDFGAGGKGYLADLVGGLIEAAGVRAYRVDAGGDIVCRGGQPVRVGLEDPDDSGKAIGVATVTDGSICGSAGNRRAWGEFHHTIDPRTLASPKHILATWTMARSGLVADALATALYFADARTLRTVYDFEYVILYSDRSVTRSEQAPVELFTA